MVLSLHVGMKSKGIKKHLKLKVAPFFNIR